MKSSPSAADELPAWREELAALDALRGARAYATLERWATSHPRRNRERLVTLPLNLKNPDSRFSFIVLRTDEVLWAHPCVPLDSPLAQSVQPLLCPWGQDTGLLHRLIETWQPDKALQVLRQGVVLNEDQEQEEWVHALVRQGHREEAKAVWAEFMRHPQRHSVLAPDQYAVDSILQSLVLSSAPPLRGEKVYRPADDPSRWPSELLHHWLQAAVEAGIELDHISWEGQTALQLAAQHHHPEAVRWLLAMGADWRKMDDQGHSALSLLLLNAPSPRTKPYFEEALALLVHAGAGQAAQKDPQHDHWHSAKLGNVTALFKKGLEQGRARIEGQHLTQALQASASTPSLRRPRL